MIVSDSAGVATDEVLASVERTISEFAEWTDVEGVCVPEIRLVASDDPSLQGNLGWFKGLHAPILLDAEHPDVVATARHELCHAYDSATGFSEARGNLFPEEDAPDAKGTRETFALVCENTPRALAFAQLFLEQCGSTDALAAAAVLDGVYSQADVSKGVSGTVPLAFDRLTVAIPAGRVLDTRTVSEGYPVVLALADGSDAVPTVLRLSNDDATLISQIEVSSDLAEGAQWLATGGSSRVYLLGTHAGRASAWHLDFEGGQALPAAAPEAASTATRLVGTLQAETVWLMDSAVTSPPLVRWDPETGAETTVEWPSEAPDWADDFGSGGAGAAMVASEGALYVGGARGFARFVNDEGAWEFIEGVAPEVEQSRLAELEADLLLGFASMGWAGSTPMTLRSLVLYDESTDEWLMPEDACAGADVIGFPYLSGYSENVWMWEFDGQSNRQHLARIRLDESTR
jgi:hypothetical protein